MVDKKLYIEIAENYGKVASWAVWDKAGKKAKSNISNMSIFDLATNPSVLDVLQTKVVMVALNFARDIEMPEPFLNFHASNPHAQDYKIRYAFEGTNYYGAYMTDIVKNFPMLSSKEVVKYLKDNPHEISVQINSFIDELRFIRAERPMILAFGREAYEIINKNLDSIYYSKLIRLTHYSHQVSKEDYRIDTHKKLGI